MRLGSPILSPDVLDRRVLLAVELVDPITHVLIYQGVSVRAAGLMATPIVSHAGRFVWLEEADAWPTEISVDPRRLPFAAHRVTAPPRPVDLQTAPAAERLARVTLRPSLAYPFEDGATVIRGLVRETVESSSDPVTGARVQLAWADDQGNWQPPPPAPEAAVDEEAPSPVEQETDTHGEFVAFLQLQPPPNVTPDVEEDLLKVRLQITRGRALPETRATPDLFRFIPAEQDPGDTKRGRVREGRVHGRDVPLAWSDLIPI